METIKQDFYVMNKSACQLGFQLKLLRDSKDFKKYDVIHWTQFLDMIGMSYAESVKYISLYESINNIGVIPVISPNRLKKIIKYYKLSTDRDLQGWITLAELAPQKDFNDEINKLKGNKSYMECQHEKTEILIHCKTCHRWLSKEVYQTHTEKDYEDQETKPEITKEKT